MISTLSNRITKSGTLGLIALLLVMAAAMCILLSPLAFLLGGLDGIVAAAVAAAAVWAASACGIAIGELFHGPNAALFKLLFGMIIRMGLTLCACLLVLLTDSSPARAGFVFYALAFYLAILPIDAWSAVLRTNSTAIANN